MLPFQSLQPSEQDLLKALLPPLLEDFQYWFTRSIDLLEDDSMPFLNDLQQSDLLTRLKLAHQEVVTAQMLFTATNGEVGIATATLMPWHRLLEECWRVSRQWRQTRAIVPDNLPPHP